MDLVTARGHVAAALERMRAAYLQPVFDEWAILSASAKGGAVLAYEGPRRDDFRRMISKDAEPLRTQTAGKKFSEGDLEFVTDADGSRYDAFLKTGPASYLVLNNTKRTLADIRADPKWLGAQASLFELTEKFRSDPLEG